MPKKKKTATEEFEQALKSADRPGKKIMLRLFVTGSTPSSIRAIENIRKICREHLQDRYELEVVDIYQQPDLLKDEQIVAAPTLIKKLPLPLRKFIGDLSDSEKILEGLQIKTAR